MSDAPYNGDDDLRSREIDDHTQEKEGMEADEPAPLAELPIINGEPIGLLGDPRAVDE